MKDPAMGPFSFVIKLLAIYPLDIIPYFYFMTYAHYTLKDIAKALKLSPSTVSRALRDSHEISKETKVLVNDFAKKVNYRVNPIARGLKVRKSFSIGIIVSEIANNFFSQVVDGIESVAYAKNYQVVIAQTKESAERESLHVEQFYARSMDGILMAMSSETHNYEYLHDLIQRGFPIVFFDRVPQQLNSHKVITDNKKGAYEAVQYLANKGCKRIAHLTSSKKLSNSMERLAGYKLALMANHQEYEEKLVKYCDYGGLQQTEIEEALHELAKEQFDGIFISGDRLTTGYLQALKKFPGLISDQIPIAGFTNSDLVDIFSPSITAVRQSAFEMGKRAAELLIEQIEAKGAKPDYQTEVLPVSLIHFAE